jgi:antagonist of KipI
VAVIEVLAPGALTTVQDLGRFGFGRLGVSPGGAADTLALRLANLLVGNAPGEAALEITLLGPRLRFAAATLVAVAGADLGPRLDGRAAPMHAGLEAPAGSELAFTGGARGARAYLAVAGGFDVPAALGSAATDLRGGFGGVEGRALRAGDRLAIGARRGRPARPDADALPPLLARRQTLRVVRGVHGERFTRAARERLTGAAYVVRTESDRMGVRLSGPPLELERPLELLSEGVGPGSIQVPPGGAPIVLGVDHPATGGYPQIAHLIAADLPSLAQLRPHMEVRFEWVEEGAARAALLEQEACLQAALGSRAGG